MKLFVDTANINEIRQTAAMGLVKGVTTNPSLLAKEDPNTDIKKLLLEIYSLLPGHLSVEVNSLKTDEMLKEADEILSWFPQATIKIPFCTDGLQATYELSKRNIPTNVTLLFSATQAIAANSCGATYVSIFMGRLDDIGNDSVATINDVCDIWAVNSYESQIIAASIRHPIHLIEAAKAGADISTVPYKVLMQSLKHPLTDAGIKIFTDDYNKMKAEKSSL